MIANVVQMPTKPQYIVSIVDKGDVVRILAQELRNAPKSAKLIAAYTGLSANTLYGITSGRTKWPREVTVLTLLEYFKYRMVLQKF